MKVELSKSQRWEDIVFEYSNKAYGAYENRRSYSKHVLLGALISILCAALVLTYPTIIDWIKGQQKMEEVPLKTVKYTDLAPPPPIENTPPPPQVNIPPPVKTIIKYLPPKVTDKEIIEEEEMPTVEEVKQNDVGSESVEGTGEVVFDQPVEEAIEQEAEEDQIFMVVEQQAEYEGGREAMLKFISKNLRYPPSARRLGLEGAVVVSFVIDKHGAISDVQVAKGISADCDREAVRVVSMMPPWKPGKQNGRAVKSRFVLPIKFKLEG